MSFRTITNDGTRDAQILVYDRIGKYYPGDDGGISAKDFAAALDAIPPGYNVIVGINSLGGSVGDGLAIASQISARKDVTCRVDGYAASIAAVVACAGKECRMAKSAMMMIHDPATFADGTADDLRKAACALDTHKEVICSALVNKCGQTNDKVAKCMSDETWFSSQGAVDFGLADAIEEDGEDVEDSIDPNEFRRFRNYPAAAVRKPQPQKTMIKLVTALAAAGIAIDQKATDEQAAEAFTNHWKKQNELQEADKKTLESTKAALTNARNTIATGQVEAAVKAGKIIDNAETRARWQTKFVTNEVEALADLASIPTPEAPKNSAGTTLAPLPLNAAGAKATVMGDPKNKAEALSAYNALNSARERGEFYSKHRDLLLGSTN